MRWFWQGGLVDLFVGVLGSFVARIGGGLVDRLPRKACALLAYLAAKHGEMVARETLSDLLWPDRELGLGLHGVRNCLSSIRASFGDAASHHIEATTTNIRLSAAAVDLKLLETSIETDDPAELQRAVNLYRGDFLFDVRIESEPFQDWVTIERSRARNLVQELLERLVPAHQAVGRNEAAIASAEQLVALDRFSERGYRLLMQACARGGKRADALRHYARCAELLRNELEVEPEQETKDLYSEIKVSGLVARTSAVIGPSPEALRPGALGWAHLSPRLILGLEPIRYLGEDRTQERIADRLTEDLVTDLFANTHGLEIVRGGDRRSSLGSLVRADPPEVDYIFSASVQPTRDQKLRLNVRLTEANTTMLRWAERFEPDADTLLQRQTELTKEIAGDVQFALIVDAARRSLGDGSNLRATDEYLAQAHATLGDRSTPIATNEAQRWLLAALGVDLRNVAALAALARTCHHIASQPGWSDRATSRVALQTGRKAAQKALSITPKHAEAECFRGMLSSSSGELSTAAEAFDKAVEANCDLAIAHAFGGYNEAFLGHAEKTLPAIERALKIGGEDRRQSVWWFFAGFAELLLGRPEPAIAFLERSLNRNPGYGTAQLFLAAALNQAGRKSDGRRVMRAFNTRFQGYEHEAFTTQWFSRSHSPVYRAQIRPVVDELQRLGLTGA